MAEPVSILMLGSGWTSAFLIPLLEQHAISFAQTRRSPSEAEVQSGIIQFAIDGETDASDCRHLPRAKLVLVVFPLKPDIVERLVRAYEDGTGCRPAWLALGATSAWSKGVRTSDSPIDERNERAQAEQVLLRLHTPSATAQRRTAVLNLAGLYGGARNPVNFAKRACGTREKTREKTSLHLIHGKDVARAILGMWNALQDDGSMRERAWGRRWMVTDTHVYDWWQLLSTLQPKPIVEGPEWVEGLMRESNVSVLPRPWPKEGKDNVVPKVLERALDSHSFWRAIDTTPSVGRCDEYTGTGGGVEFHAIQNAKSSAL